MSNNEKKRKAEERAARAKALLAQQRRAERRRNVMLGGIVVVVLALVVVGGYFLLHKNSEVNAPVASKYGVTVGNDDAPNKVIVYEDFLCPFCDALETATRDQLAQDAQSGLVQISYRPFDLLGRGDPTSYSARAAGAFSVVLDTSGPTVAKKFHDLLYENQPSEQGPFPDNAALLKLAVQAGADESAVSDGITNNGGSSWVTEATQQAEDANVQGTPTVILNGQQFGSGLPVDQLASKLTAAVKEQ